MMTMMNGGMCDNRGDFLGCLQGLLNRIAWRTITLAVFLHQHLVKSNRTIPKNNYFLSDKKSCWLNSKYHFQNVQLIKSV